MDDTTELVFEQARSALLARALHAMADVITALLIPGRANDPQTSRRLIEFSKELVADHGRLQKARKTKDLEEAYFGIRAISWRCEEVQALQNMVGEMLNQVRTQ